MTPITPRDAYREWRAMGVGVTLVSVLTLAAAGVTDVDIGGSAPWFILLGATVAGFALWVTGEWRLRALHKEATA